MRFCKSNTPTAVSFKNTKKSFCIKSTDTVFLQAKGYAAPQEYNTQTQNKGYVFLSGGLFHLAVHHNWFTAHYLLLEEKCFLFRTC